jgi:hypothetical protein
MSMKKIIPILLCLSMLLTVGIATIPSSALSDSVSDSTWSEIELKALVYQDGEYFYSELAEKYENYDSGWKTISELDDEERAICSLNMRGFCVTPDGKYGLMGHLNASDFRGCALFDFATGTITDVYYRYDSEQDPSIATPFSFVKGIAADDRGNVYCGFSFSTNYNLASLGIAHINDETKTFEELWEGPVYQFGDKPGDESGIKVGINGVEVAKVGDRYYCYVVTNYTYDALYCFDVTDPSKPVLNTEFGTNGCIDFTDDQCPVRTADSTLDEGYYLAVDADGVIWLTAKLKDGKKALMKIAPDGSSCVASYEMEDPYSICHAGRYILIGNKNGQAVTVYDDDEMKEIAVLKYEEPYGTCITRIQVVNDILFVADGQENDSSLRNAVLVAGLTPEAQAAVDDMVKALNGDGSEETGVPTDFGKDNTAEPETVTEPETATETDKAVAGNETETATIGSDTAATTAASTETEKESGCASAVSASAAGVAALILAGAGTAFRKKQTRMNDGNAD